MLFDVNSIYCEHSHSLFFGLLAKNVKIKTADAPGASLFIYSSKSFRDIRF